MRLASLLALLAIVCASALAVRPHSVPVVIAPAPPDPRVVALEAELGRIDARVDRAMQVLVDDPDEVEHERARAKLRELQAELAEMKKRVAIAKAAFAREHCPGGRVTRVCP
jgi:hypothetical protein